MNSWRRRLVWLLLPAALIVLDQLSKAIVRAHIGVHEKIELLEGFFRLNHVQNEGAAFGLFADLPPGYREAVLTSLAAIALILVVVYSLRLDPGEWISQAGLHMIFAGAIGNLIDRFIFGSVTDFLEFHWHTSFHWPAFNVADSAIVVGVAALLVDTFRSRRGPVAIDVAGEEIAGEAIENEHYALVGAEDRGKAAVEDNEGFAEGDVDSEKAADAEPRTGEPDVS